MNREHRCLKEGATFTCPNCGYKYELSAKTLGPTTQGKEKLEPKQKTGPELPKPDEVETPSPETEVSPQAPKESRVGKALDSLMG